MTTNRPRVPRKSAAAIAFAAPRALPAGGRGRAGKTRSDSGSKKKRNVQWEAREQRALIQWARVAVGRYPELASLFHPANGGARDGLTASLMKAEGVRPGVLDLILLKPRGVYHGLAVELKATGATASSLSADQRLEIQTLSEDGYLAVGVNGWEVAKAVIEAYLQLPPFGALNGMLKIPNSLWIGKACEILQNVPNKCS